jgi:MtN3 and saliva related transmembrane protein
MPWSNESGLEVSRVLTLLASLAISFGLYAQVWKMYRTGSVRDFTPVLLFALLTSELAWLNYGLVLREWPIILISGANLPAAVLAAAAYLRYRPREPADQCGPLFQPARPLGPIRVTSMADS